MPQFQIRLCVKKMIGCIRLHRDVDLSFCQGGGCQYYGGMASPDELICKYPLPKEFRRKIFENLGKKMKKHT